MPVQILPTVPSWQSRLGQGISQGLSESVPEEIKYQRTRSGLQSLANKSGTLSPEQYLAEAAGVYGATPQMIQSFAELAKNQRVRNAYKGTGQEKKPSSSADISKIEFANQQKRTDQAIQQQAQEQGNLSRQVANTLPQDFANREEEAQANPPAANENPLADKFQPAAPWSQEMQQEAINEAFDKGLAENFNEANAYANQQREIYQNAPAAYREQLEYKKGVDKEVDKLMDDKLAVQLQKEKGNEIYQDVSGTMQLKAKKMARNSVAKGDMTPEQASEFYTRKLLDLAEAKGEIQRISQRDVLDKALPWKKAENVKSIQQVAKLYDDMGNSEELYKLLQTSPEKGGLGLSPGGAGYLTYKPSAGIDKVLNKKENKRLIANKTFAEQSRRVTSELMKELTPKDSIQGLMRRMKENDPYFDERAAFDYIRENEDDLGLNQRQRNEVIRGVSDFYPNWGDVFLFPAIGKSS